MFGEDLVVLTRLTPPRLPRRWLRRPRLDQRFAAVAEHRLTLLTAAAGYGKSSALGSFAARGGWPTAWYSVGDPGDDPLVFLLHLIYACRVLAPQAGMRSLALLEAGQRGTALWNQALDLLANDLLASLSDEAILVIDDYHMIDDSDQLRALIERLLDHLPPQLHLVLASRRQPRLARLPILRARDELYELGISDLAFTADEIAELFADTYQRTLQAGEVEQLVAQTGGWAMALQLFGQVSQAGDLPQVLAPGGQHGTTHAALFDYLARDVLAHQPAELRGFLLRSAALAELRPADCDAILGRNDSAELLRELERRGLFIGRLALPEASASNGPQHAPTYRYHPLFAAFLREQARRECSDWAAIHHRAAGYYRAAGAGELVLGHLLAVGASSEAAAELERWVQPWLAAGRLTSLLGWIAQLDPAVLAQRPHLLVANGDAHRLLARFDQALPAYAAAATAAAQQGDTLAEAQALRGQALVYLDTLQPALADGLLRRAFRLLPASAQAARADVLRLLAENRLNQGRADQAARLLRFATAAARRPLAANQRGDQPAAAALVELEARILLRQGRLAAARTLLETTLLQRGNHQPASRPPAAHRELSLQLSLLCLFAGEPAAARRYAQQALDEAHQLGSALAEALAHARLGHTHQLAPQPDAAAALGHYIQMLALADTMGVPRTRVEAFLGLTLLHGLNGDRAAAQAAAQEGLTIAAQGGDTWTVAQLRLALGVAETVSDADSAATTLSLALQGYRACHDSYGEALAQLWLAIGYQRVGNTTAAQPHVQALLALVQRHGYEALLTNRTLLGPRDRMMLVPVLLAGRAMPEYQAFAQQLLVRGFATIANDEATQLYHPGSTLRIQLFDRLRAWRGPLEIEPRAWQRKKARQMLGLLLTFRQRWLLREQICEWLWPEEGEADAETQFKVTLNALNTTLEPQRPPRTPPFYIRRQGGAYRFCPPDGVWIDTAAFEAELVAAETSNDPAIVRARLEAAVALYQGDYLNDNLYEEWTRDERDRLAAGFMQAATRLAGLSLSQGRLPEVVRLADLLLARDPCWEDAYLLQMRAYQLQGNRRLALASYERCVRNLREQLGVAPQRETRQLYESLTGVTR